MTAEERRHIHAETERLYLKGERDALRVSVEDLTRTLAEIARGRRDGMPYIGQVAQRMARERLDQLGIGYNQAAGRGNMGQADDMRLGRRQAEAEIFALRAALRRALPFLVNDESPGGCDGKQPGCPHCEAIACVRAALGDPQ